MVATSSSLLCPQCGKTYETNKELHDHYCRNRPQVKCESCGEIFTSHQNLKIHNDSIHKEKTFSCTECEEVFKQSSSLYRHKRLHTSDSFNCDGCSKTFVRKDKLNLHIKSCRNKAFTDAINKQKQQLNDAINKQKLEKPKHTKINFPCPQCSLKINAYAVKIKNV